MKSALLIGWKEWLGIKNFTQTSVTTSAFFIYLFFLMKQKTPESWKSTEERNTAAFSAISCFILKNKKSERKRRRRRRKQWKDERIRGRICAVFSQRETDDANAESCFSEPSEVFWAWLSPVWKKENNIQSRIVKICLENLIKSNILNLTGELRWEETDLKGGSWLYIL